MTESGRDPPASPDRQRWVDSGRSAFGRRLAEADSYRLKEAHDRTEKRARQRRAAKS